MAQARLDQANRAAAGRDAQIELGTYHIIHVPVAAPLDAENRFRRSIALFFFSSRRRHTRSVSAFLLNRSSDLHSFATRRTLFHVLVGCGLLMLKVSRLRSEERRVGKECRSRWSPDH